MKFVLKYLCFIFALSLSSLLYAQTQTAKQWVEVRSNLEESMYYDISANYLKSSIVDCGINCHLVKLSSTPFQAGGDLTIHFYSHDMFCGDIGTYSIPFVVKDGQLETNVKTERVGFENNMCMKRVKVTISDSTAPNVRYKVELLRDNF